ncbi:MAG: 2-C-methyl-D-erythritol 4-phosphate cytidylyltransferase, partial [Clostridia bacterium]|nr:2-C-methyl-D-erythritol 4-phosphate cytidylyltransferase [Clostridia bacterium]
MPVRIRMTQEKSEMQSDIPKQYMLIADKPVLYYALKRFQESSVNDIILVTSEDDVSYCKESIV